MMMGKAMGHHPLPLPERMHSQTCNKFYNISNLCFFAKFWQRGWRSGSAFVSDAKGRGFKSRTPYVSHFWAPGCGPTFCHLKHLSRQYYVSIFPKLENSRCHADVVLPYIIATTTTHRAIYTCNRASAGQTAHWELDSILAHSPKMFLPRIPACAGHTPSFSRQFALMCHDNNGTQLHSIALNARH